MKKGKGKAGEKFGPDYFSFFSFVVQKVEPSELRFLNPDVGQEKLVIV